MTETLHTHQPVKPEADMAKTGEFIAEAEVREHLQGLRDEDWYRAVGQYLLYRGTDDQGYNS